MQPIVPEPIEKLKTLACFPYFGAKSAKLTKEPSFVLSNFILHYYHVLVQFNRHKIGSLFNFQLQAAHLKTLFAGIQVKMYTRCTRVRGFDLTYPPHQNWQTSSQKPPHWFSLFIPCSVRLHTANCVGGIPVSDIDFKIPSSYECNRETRLFLESMMV